MEVSTSGRRPVDGIRVLDFTRFLAGPYLTRSLAVMGTDPRFASNAERSRRQEEVLREVLGYSEEQVAGLERSGAVYAEPEV